MKTYKHTLLFMLLLISACNFPGKGDVVIPEQPVPTLEQIQEEPTPEPATDTPEPAPSFSRPDGFIDYSDQIAGVTISYPENWIVTGIIEGDYAIFQSYPLDKYIGGEGFHPGDTKCDLNLSPNAESTEDILAQWTSDGLSEIVSQESLTLASGLPGTRVELEGWGGSYTMFTEIDGRLITFTCYGAFEFFDDIAGSIRPTD